MKPLNWLAILGCVGVAAGVSLAAQGCTATVNTGGTVNGNGDDDGTNFDSGIVDRGDSGGSAAPGPCLDCLYGQCSGDYTACVTDPGCAAIYECATATACASDTTGNCVTQCVASGTTASQDLYANLGICDLTAQCNGGTCAATCTPTAAYCAPLTTDDDAGATPDDAGSTAQDSAAPTCQDCQQSSCATQYTDCQTTTSACATYNTCVLGCQDAACVTACQTNNEAGYTAAQALGTCTSSNCPICSQ